MASASAGGTIAAVRNLAANAFDVRVLCSDILSASAWSRHVTGSHAFPSENNSHRFFSRLLAVGAADPGRILLPTSDKTAWIYASNAGVLQRYFFTYQPSITVIQRMLDKKLFAEAAGKSGFASLPIWDPRSVADLHALAPSLPYPIIVKPRSHIYRQRNDKGFVVHSAKELVACYQRFIAREQDQEPGRLHPPDFVRPILQYFVGVGREGVQSITGFIDRTGELFVTRRSRKVFQRSRHVGVGVCFESLPPAPALARAVRALCRQLGYFGIFEVELVPFDGGWAAIDFNPRFYNQMGMDIARGMPLPLFSCLGALGDITALRDAVARAQQDDGIETVFYDRFTLYAIMAAQFVTAQMSRDDLAYWHAWTKRKAGRAIYVAADKNDPIPGIIHALSEAYLGFKAIPRFVHSAPAGSASPPRALRKARP